VALGDLERHVVALAVVHEHDLVHDAVQALKAALDDWLLVAHDKAGGDGSSRWRVVFDGFHRGPG
jgi:hypothetical protein